MEEKEKVGMKDGPTTQKEIEDNNHFNHFSSRVETQSLTQNPTASIINFYKILFNDVKDLNLDMDQVLSEYIETSEKLKPSSNCSDRIKDIQKYLSNLSKQQVNELAMSLASSSDQQLYDNIQAVEKLYMRLMIEYNYELHRAQGMGLFKPKK